MSLGGIAQLVRAPASHAGGHRFEPRCLHQKTAALVRGWPFFLLHRGSKDERYRATVRWTVATASDQAPAGARVEPRCLHQKTAALVRGWPFFLLHRSSKDERHRATVRWTVVTASDQAPAGARVEPRCLHHEKSTSSEVLFSMKRTLRCMKNEARLRLMKRDFAVLMVRALHLTSCWIYGNLFE